jgi:D-alanyl-D-alanine carboxypeptidase (penicillin-binding protein 5/6)
MTFNVSNVYAQEFDITAKNVILYNLNDNDILYEKESNEKVEIASLTKIMTTIVAIENIDNLEEEVNITNDVFEGINDYAQAGLKVGDKVTYLDLLYGVMLPSGADCVNAIILNVADSPNNYIKLMNDKAKELKLTNTKFDNAIGMDSDNNYSTAKDLAILLKYALKNETFKTIYTTKKYTINSNNLILKSTLVTYSKGGLDIDNIKGAKSGFTDEAGVCLASIATIDDVNYLLVVLGSDATNHANAIKDSLAIYNYYGNNYGYKKVINKGQVFTKIDVKWGKQKKYNIKSDKDIKLYLENSISEDALEYEYKGVEELTYKNKVGQKLGVVSVKYNDEVLTTYDVYLDDTLEYYHPVIYTVMIVCILLILLSLISMKKKKKKKRRKKRCKK